MQKKWMTMAAGLVLAGVAQAAPFANGSFESGTDPGTFTNVPSSTTDITNWTATQIDYIGSYWNAQDGSRSIDLNGTNAGSIAQTFDTVAGHSYSVRFALAGNPDCGPTVKSVQVQATGGAASNYTFDTTGHSKSSMGWETQTYMFTANGASTTLSFASQNSGSACGPALDNVVVTDITPAPVPTLSQWALLGLAGLLGMFALRRRGLLR